MNLKSRFWEKVGIYNSHSDCWEWRGTKRSDGYGNIRSDGKVIRAHRLSYTLNVGKIPNGIFVLHRCDNPSCVNPRHLFLGTAKDNSQDMMSKGRNMHITKPWTLARGDRNGTHTKPETVRRGSRIEWAKLDEGKVREIRSRYSGGESAPTLAKEFGVYFGTIYKVIYRHTWKTA